MSSIQKSESTALQSDVRPVPASGNSIANVHLLGTPNIDTAHRSGNVSTIVAANSGAYAPAGMLTLNVSGSVKHIPYFNV